MKEILNFLRLPKASKEMLPERLSSKLWWHLCTVSHSSVLVNRFKDSWRIRDSMKLTVTCTRPLNILPKLQSNVSEICSAMPIALRKGSLSVQRLWLTLGSQLSGSLLLDSHASSLTSLNRKRTLSVQLFSLSQLQKALMINPSINRSKIQHSLLITFIRSIQLIWCSPLSNVINSKFIINH